MANTISIAEMRRQARTLFKDRMEISSDLAEEITRRLTNDVVRLLMAETAHNRPVPADDGEVIQTNGQDEIINLPELDEEEVPELAAIASAGEWLAVTITDPITVSKGNKLRIRGLCVHDGKTYRFWDEFNLDLSVATARFRRLREAAGMPNGPVYRKELVGKRVEVSYEQRDSGKMMPGNYQRYGESSANQHKRE
jgi:hypothetical protein